MLKYLLTLNGFGIFGLQLLCVGISIVVFVSVLYVVERYFNGSIFIALLLLALFVILAGILFMIAG